MKLNDYQALAMRTRPKSIWPTQFLNAGIGMVGEAAEVLDHVKKVHFHGHDRDKQKLIEEMGDCMWYMALMAELIGTTLEEVAEANIEKLQKRYPSEEGFTTEDSIRRVDAHV